MMVPFSEIPRDRSLLIFGLLIFAAVVKAYGANSFPVALYVLIVIGFPLLAIIFLFRSSDGGIGKMWKISAILGLSVVMLLLGISSIRYEIFPQDWGYIRIDRFTDKAEACDADGCVPYRDPTP